MRLKRSIERVEKIINDPKYEDLKKLFEHSRGRERGECTRLLPRAR